MKLSTRLFGEIEVDDSKILVFTDGLIGFPELKKFMLIHDGESEESFISWLQSIEDPEYVLPIISPLEVDESYNPTIEDELLAVIEPDGGDDLAVFTTLRVTSNIKEMTSNFRAPIIINSHSLKGCQIIVENEEYSVKMPIYDQLKKKSKKAGE